MIGTGAGMSPWQILRYGMPLFLIVGSLVTVGWMALRWPLLQPALATAYLFVQLGKDLEPSDWPRLFLAYAVVYFMALLLASGAFVFRRRKAVVPGQ